jgi:glucokinase
MAQPEASTEMDSAPILIGVDLGSQHIRAGAVDRTGRLLSFRREPYTATGESEASGRALADQLLAAVTGLIGEQAASLPVAAIGVGFPGLVHQTTHRIVNLPHAPSLVHLDLYQEFERAFGLPVIFENNANAAAFAEMTRGVAQGAPDWLYLSIGAGVGAGLVLDGKLRRGKSGFAGEIGHINIDPDGIECACGSLGCLETMVSAPNIVRRTRIRLHRDSTSSLSRFGEQGVFTYEDIIAAANQGDDLARMMLQRTGSFMGMAVADVINLLNLSLVVIGGHPGARPFLVPAIAEEARRRAFAAVFEDCRILAAELGEEAGVIGAALLAHKSISS